MRTNRVRYEYPRVFHPLFEVGRGMRTVVLHGGRGSGKSWALAAYLVQRAALEKLFILCARQYQNSIADSVLSLLEATIRQQGLTDLFKVGRTTITCPSTGSVFIFRGLQTNPQSVRSLEGLDACWVEEGQTISALALRSLVPTMRKANSQILISMNPVNEDDAVWERYLSKWWEAEGKGVPYVPPEDTLLIRANHNHNPFFTDELRKEMEWDYERDPLLADHIWGGIPHGRLDRLIFPPGTYEVGEAPDVPDLGRPLFGVDIGHTIDASAILKVYRPDERTLYVDDERYAWKLDSYSIPRFLKSMPGASDHVITSDWQWREIHQMLRTEHGLTMHHAVKGPHSVHEGLMFIKGHRVIINPRCRNLLKECSHYGYEVDKTTDEVKPKIDDSWNHGWDAVRYAIEHLRRKSGTRHVGVLA